MFILVFKKTLYFVMSSEHNNNILFYLLVHSIFLLNIIIMKILLSVTFCLLVHLIWYSLKRNVCLCMFRAAMKMANMDAVLGYMFTNPLDKNNVNSHDSYMFIE